MYNLRSFNTRRNYVFHKEEWKLKVKRIEKTVKYHENRHVPKELSWKIEKKKNKMKEKTDSVEVKHATTSTVSLSRSTYVIIVLFIPMYL